MINSTIRANSTVVVIVDGSGEIEFLIAITMSDKHGNVIGLVPAAGQASRLEPLPVSKELFPVGFGPVRGKQGLRPKVAAQYLLEQMQLAGAGKAFIVLRKGKWDIPNYFGDGQGQHMHLAYLIMRHPYGVPYTLDQAYPFIPSATIIFGFPDVIFFPKNAYVRLLDQLSDSGADIALGVFKVKRRPEKMDMLEMDAQDRIRRIVIKPEQTSLRDTWIAAAWTPRFTEFMHEYVTRDALERGQSAMGESAVDKELHMGDVLNAALESKMKTTTVRFDSDSFLDIGTPEDIVLASEFIKPFDNVQP